MSSYTEGLGGKYEMNDDQRLLMWQATRVREEINKEKPHGEKAYGLKRTNIRKTAYDHNTNGAPLSSTNRVKMLIKYRQIMSKTVASMPPPTNLVELLLEMIVLQVDGRNNETAWAAIGIKQDRGKGLLSKNARAVDWPIWKTLRDEALK